MIALGIILLVIGIALIVIGLIGEAKERDFCKTTTGWFAGGLFVLGLVILAHTKEITPMDVYQGKTTLQYTIVDSVKVDSTVVWKNKEKIDYDK